MPTDLAERTIVVFGVVVELRKNQAFILVDIKIICHRKRHFYQLKGSRKDCSHINSLHQIFEPCFPDNYYFKFLRNRSPIHAFNHKNEISLPNKEKLSKLSYDSGFKMHSLKLGVVCCASGSCLQ